MQESVQLNWNGFSDKRTSALQQLREAEFLTDVTLVCDDETMPAHAVVLSTASPLLARLLLHATPAHPALLFLRGATQAQLAALTQFCYTGECAVPLQELQLFLQLGRDLQLTGLEDNIKEFDQIQPIFEGNSEKTIASYFQKKDVKDSKLLQPQVKLDILAKLEASSTKEEVFSDKETSKQMKSRGTQKIAMPKHVIRTSSGKYSRCITMFSDVPEGGIKAIPGSMAEIEWNTKITSHMVKTDGIIRCTHCEYESRVKGYIKEHVETHIRGYYFPCLRCCKWAPSKRFLRHHIRACKGDE